MWQFIGYNTDEKSFLISDINIWSFAWYDVGEKVEVKHPSYNQLHDFYVYTIFNGERVVKFAAGEFSNGVWGFYVMR